MCDLEALFEWNLTDLFSSSNMPLDCADTWEHVLGMGWGLSSPANTFNGRSRCWKIWRRSSQRPKIPIRKVLLVSSMLYAFSFFILHAFEISCQLKGFWLLKGFWIVEGRYFS